MGDAQIRANFASSVKRIYEYAKAADFSTLTVEAVQVRLDRLETVWRQFDTENEKVLLNLTLTQDEDKQMNEKLYADTEEMYVDAKVILTEQVSKFMKSDKATAPAADQTPA